MSLFVSPVFSHGEYTTAQDPGHKRRKVICSRPLPSLPWQTLSRAKDGRRRVPFNLENGTNE